MNSRCIVAHMLVGSDVNSMYVVPWTRGTGCSLATMMTPKVQLDAKLMLSHVRMLSLSDISHAFRCCLMFAFSCYSAPSLIPVTLQLILAFRPFCFPHSVRLPHSFSLSQLVLLTSPCISLLNLRMQAWGEDVEECMRALKRFFERHGLDYDTPIWFCVFSK